MFRLKEVMRWLGITVFEMLLFSVALLFYSFLLTLKIEGPLSQSSWWSIHSPLFVADALVVYFCTIVFIRQYMEGTYRVAVFRALWSFNQVLLLFLGKLLLCYRLEGQKHITHSEVFSPLFVLLILLVIRACQLH